tara:strand:+ start:857 stop:1729 length:873 start_codon:yes stop_codon:yes gene_type:complete
MNFRTKKCFNVIQFPEGFKEEDRIKCKTDCCDAQLKLASLIDNDNYQNDVTGITIKKADLSDIVEFEITNCDDPNTPLPLLGEIGNYPQDDLATGFIFVWKEYLAAYGEGKYNINVNFTISGVVGGYLYGQYELQKYSIQSARHTFRVWSEFKSYFQKQNIDFTDSNFKDSIRAFGFFGNRQTKTEINNLISAGRKVEKVTRENLNEYKLTTDPVSITISRQLLNFHFLNEDVTLISDHNRHNHDYLLFDVPVVLEETPEIEYQSRNRGATITATFGDRNKLSKSFYNVK